MNTDLKKEKPQAEQPARESPVTPLARLPSDFERVFKERVNMNKAGHTNDIVRGS